MRCTTLLHFRYVWLRPIIFIHLLTPFLCYYCSLTVCLSYLIEISLYLSSYIINCDIHILFYKSKACVGVNAYAERAFYRTIMACLARLKDDTRFLESTFPRDHERFQIISASVDEVSCKFITTGGGNDCKRCQSVIMTAHFCVSD